MDVFKIGDEVEFTREFDILGGYNRICKTGVITDIFDNHVIVGRGIGLYKESYLVKYENLKKINRSMENYIYIKELDKKIPISDETVENIRDAQKEELKTFRDCWDKVKPIFHMDTIGEIRGGICEGENAYNYPNLPRKELVEKVKLYIKLLVVAEAVNDGWVYKNGGSRYYCIYLKKDNKLRVIHGNMISGDIKFKDKETAQKAIDICPEVWKEYLTIN